MVWLQTLAGVFAMCSQVRHFTLMVSLFIQVNNGYWQLYADGVGGGGGGGTLGWTGILSTREQKYYGQEFLVTYLFTCIVWRNFEPMML